MDDAPPLACRSAREILREYPAIRPQQIQFLGGAGGFSGSRFWHITAAEGKYGLRRWPAGNPDAQRLEFIHAVLRHVAGHGFARVPVPLTTRDAATCVSREGHLWELTPWLPGQADYRQRPSPQRLRSALVALAEFHLAAASFAAVRPAWGGGSYDNQGGELGAVVGVIAGPPSRGPSPGLQERHKQLEVWLGGQVDDLRIHLAVDRRRPLAELGWAILDDFALAVPGVSDLLDRASGIESPLQVCIRDIWHDHVLFQGDQVTGIVDFGSMQKENVAADIARLLGSLVGDSSEGWAAGLAAYRFVRPLSPEEERLIGAFDRSTVLMSGLNWLDWLFRDNRQFEDLEVVERRLKEIAGRLRYLARTGPPVWDGPSGHVFL